MSSPTFSKYELILSRLQKKTIMSFQYIEGKNGKYIAEGSLEQIAEFLSGSTAKILVQSNLDEDKLDSFLSVFSDRVKELYKNNKR